jgi:hypothetical protein
LERVQKSRTKPWDRESNHIAGVEAQDREAVAPLGEDAQQAAGQRLPSVGGDKRDRVVGTGAALTSNQVQGIGSMQQFIDEATTRDKHTQWQDFLELGTGHPQGADDFIRGHEKGRQPTYPVFSQRVLHAPIKELLARSAV